MKRGNFKRFGSKLPVLASILLLLLFSCARTEKIEKGDDYEAGLKVMTFNIRYGSADDGENSWQYRKNYLFETIMKFDPDLLGLQEALDFQIKELLDELPGYSYVGVGRDNGKTKGEYSALFYSKDRFIIDTTETFWFSPTPSVAGSLTWWSTFPRICSWAKMFDKFTGKSFYVYNIHYDHQSQESREKSSDMLMAKIKSANPVLPVILMGDFNCGETNPAIEKILSGGLIDSYRAMNEPMNNEGTFNNFTGDTSGEKIDFIFVSRDFTVKSSKIDRSSFNGKYPSDHFPVTAELVFKK